MSFGDFEGDACPHSSIFGWQGIVVQAPRAWELGAYGGDFKSGHAYLDDGESVRMRIQWGLAQASASDLQKVLEDRARSLGGKSKRRVRLQRLDERLFSDEFRKNKELATFWLQDNESFEDMFGVCWRCGVCGRLTLIEVAPAESGDEPRQAFEILSSASDHRTDGRMLWSVYGFAFRMPETYNLREARLQSGRLQFVFQEGTRAWARVERWAMAAQVLRKLPLEGWPEELMKLAGVRPRGSMDIAAASVRGAQACRFRGDAVQGRFLGRTDAFEGMVWHDADKDKVLAAVVVGDEPGVLCDLVDSIECV